MMADLVVGWLQNIGKDLLEWPLTREDDAIAAEDLLAPMLEVGTVCVRVHHATWRQQTLFATTWTATKRSQVGPF